MWPVNLCRLLLFGKLPTLDVANSRIWCKVIMTNMTEMVFKHDGIDKKVLQITLCG